MFKLTHNNTLFIAIITLTLSACVSGVDDTGVEYAPQMYHSTPYEPLSQITNKDAGNWLDSNPEDGHGEFYNSNGFNPYSMNMRKPVANTVRRGEMIPYLLKEEDLEQAESMESPFDDSKDLLKDGKLLYNSFCKHCHGDKGNGDGTVAEIFAGVANLNGAAYKGLSKGHIFHVITYGKGLMGAHGSQISQEDRWKIAHYVKELQNN